MTKNTDKPAVQFGAGNIGRGCMGQLFWEGGFDTVFVDANASLVEQLNTQGSYPLRLLDAYAGSIRELTISGFKALQSDHVTAIADAVVNARVVATAVGVANLDAIAPLLAAGIRRRFERKAGAVRHYLCENMLGAAAMLSSRVISLLDGPARAWAESNVGFVGTSVARIVGGAGVRSPQDDPLLVVADAHRDIPYDGKATRAGEPDIGGFHPVSNFKAEVERKIFTHNVGHAGLAYLGYLTGHTYIHETFDDDFVRSVFDGALDETTEALLRHYPTDLDRREHMEIRKDVHVRFSNPLLRDGITRVARDPIRKLGHDDRIVGAAELCQSQGVTPSHIATICAAALCYDCPDDPHAVRLQTMIQQQGVEETLRQVSGIEPTSDFAQQVIAQFHLLRARIIGAVQFPSRQRDHLPAFGAEADVPLDEFPDDDLLALEQSGPACGQLLADQRRGPAVVDDRGQAEAQIVGQMGDEAAAAGLVPLEDPQEAVAEHQNGRVRVIRVGLPVRRVDHLRAVDLLRLVERSTCGTRIIRSTSPCRWMVTGLVSYLTGPFSTQPESSSLRATTSAASRIPSGDQ